MAGSVWAYVDNTELEEGCEAEVFDAVVKVAARYNHFGRALGLAAADLSEIQQTCHHNRQDGLEQVINLWLQQNYDTEKHGVPSWRKLVMAVESQSGGKNRAVAKKIAAEHPVRAVKTPPPPMETGPESMPTQCTQCAPAPQPGPGETYNHSPYSPQPTAPPPPYNMEYSDDSYYPSDVHQVAKLLPTPADGEVNQTRPEDCMRVFTDGAKTPHDAYNAFKRDKKLKPTKLSFDTVTPSKGSKVIPYGEYSMQKFPHGVCLIINNEDFARQNAREGTDIDEQNLVLTFRYLGYEVEVYRDQTSDGIIGIFDEMRKKDHTKYDSFVCCVLTHGKEGQIYGSDSKLIEIGSLTSKLNGSNCPTLAGKPKLFFVQACRGKGKDTAVRVDSDSDDPIEIPDEADFFFGYATPPGKVAWRDLDHGSWYVSELCRMLCTDSTHVELVDMVTKVQFDVGSKYNNMQYKQAPEHTSRLQKSLYFF